VGTAPKSPIPRPVTRQSSLKLLAERISSVDRITVRECIWLSCFAEIGIHAQKLLGGRVEVAVDQVDEARCIGVSTLETKRSGDRARRTPVSVGVVALEPVWLPLLFTCSRTPVVSDSRYDGVLPLILICSMGAELILGPYR
jgi:hypothetical protein